MASESLYARTLRVIEERTGVVSFVASIGRTPMIGGARWGHGLLFAIAALFALELATGFAVMVHYAPTTTDAWASLWRLETEIPHGRWLRGLHRQGASAIVIAIALHLLYVATTGSWRRPREATWWLALLLIPIAIGFTMTGIALPWDENGYWANRVETSVVASTPVAGPAVQAVLLGGNDYGNATLTTQLAMHAILMPLALLGVVALWALLVRRHGLVASATVAAEPSPRIVPWWPSQALRDLVMATIALAAVFVLAWKLGAPLTAPADPAAGFSARPIWFLRPLFELRKAFEGLDERLGTLVLPGVIGALLVALPLLDRRAPAFRRRIPYMLPVVVLVVGALGAAAWSIRKDRHDAAHQKQLAASQKRLDKALALATAGLGVPPEGPLWMLKNTPEERGRKLFADKCQGCHALGGDGGEKGPDFAGYGSVTWLAGVIAHPEAPEYFGHTKVSGMEAYESLGAEKLHALATFVRSLRETAGMHPDSFPERLKGGRALFEAEGCDTCHSLVPAEEGPGPSLAGYGSDEWLNGLLDEPGSPLYFGEDNSMPSYKKKLDDAQVADLLVYLRTLEDLPPRYTLTAATGP